MEPTTRQVKYVADNSTPEHTFVPKRLLFENFPEKLKNALTEKLDLRDSKNRHLRGLLVHEVIAKTFQQNLHPCMLDKKEMAKSIVETFPHLKEPVGSGYHAWFKSIVDALKNRRRNTPNKPRTVGIRKRTVATSSVTNIVDTNSSILAVTFEGFSETPSLELEYMHESASVINIGNVNRSGSSDVHESASVIDIGNVNRSRSSDVHESASVVDIGNVNSSGSSNVLESASAVGIGNVNRSRSSDVHESASVVDIGNVNSSGSSNVLESASAVGIGNVNRSGSSDVHKPASVVDIGNVNCSGSSDVHEPASKLKKNVLENLLVNHYRSSTIQSLH